MQDSEIIGVLNTNYPSVRNVMKSNLVGVREPSLFKSSTSNKKITIRFASQAESNNQFELYRIEPNGNEDINLVKKPLDQGIVEIDDRENSQKLRRINFEIQAIKSKIHALNGKKAKNEELTILQMILPKQVIEQRKQEIRRVFRSLNDTKQHSNNESKLNPISKSLKLYNNVEEIVKKLKYFDNESNIIKQSKDMKEVNKKLVIKDINFKPVIPDFKAEIRKSIIEKSRMDLISVQPGSMEKSTTDPTPKNKTSTRLLKFEFDESSSKQLIIIPHTIENLIKIDDPSQFSNLAISNSHLKAENCNAASRNLKDRGSQVSILPAIDNTRAFTEIRDDNADDENRGMSNLNFFHNKMLMSPNLREKRGTIYLNTASAFKGETVNEVTFNAVATTEEQDALLSIQSQSKKEDELTTANKQNVLAKEEKGEAKLAIEIGKYKAYLIKYKYLCEGLEGINRRLNEILIEKDAVSVIIEKQKELYDKPEESNKSTYSTLKTIKATTAREMSKQKTGGNHSSVVNNNQDQTSTKISQRVLLNKLLEQEKLLLKEIKHASSIKESYKQDIRILQDSISVCKEEILKIKQKLEIHYHQLLLDGSDTRGVGLTWIMLAIWNLGGEVFLSYMPPYLDNQLIHYFFLRAHKEIELAKSQRILLELKNMVRAQRGNEYRKQKKKDLFVFTKAEVS